MWEQQAHDREETVLLRPAWLSPLLTGVFGFLQVCMILVDDIGQALSRFGRGWSLENTHEMAEGQSRPDVNGAGAIVE